MQRGKKWMKFLKNEQNTKIDGWMAMKSDSETEYKHKFCVNNTMNTIWYANILEYCSIA